jgi:AcrR family transcriptional regulator
MSEPKSTNQSRRAKHRGVAVVRKSERTRQAICDAAVRVLGTRPFRDLSVADLTAATNLSRPAFYQYFSDLHDLMESLLKEIEAAMHRMANPWISGDGEPIAALRDSLRAIVKATVEHGPIFRAIKDAAPLDHRLEKAWAAFMDQWDDAVEARIKAQQRAGLVPKSLNARRVASALNALDEAVLIAEFGRHPQGDPKKVLDTLHHIWVATLYSQRLNGRSGGRRTATQRSRKTRRP